MLPLSELPWLCRAPGDYVKRLAGLDQDEPSLGASLQDLSACYLTQARLDRLGKRITRYQHEERNLAPLQPLHLALVTNATTDFLANALQATALRYGINLQLTVADFDQAAQEALDPNSPVNAAKPDVILLALDHRGLPMEFGVGKSAMGSGAQALDYLNMIRSNFSQHSGATIMLQSLARPPEVLFGSLDRRIGGTAASVIDEFNRGLVDMLDGSPDLFLDTSALAETLGLEQWHDPVRWHTAKIPFALDFLPLYCDHVCRLLAAFRGNSRKVLVLDLDNTLWGGVIGDDGLEGIELGQGDGAGEAHLAIQRCALDLSKRGIVLAVCSKNEDATAREPFRKHPEMLLKEDDFAAFVANWTDKATNIRAIAQSLNLGLDSFVFLDDNPMERDLVRQGLPQVMVPELPDDPSFYPGILAAAGYFEAVSFSSDDAQRGAQYQANLQRQKLEVTATSIDDYLASLDMQMQIAEFDELGRARIVQLINKTNQFNLTTLRADEKQVIAWDESPAFLGLQVKLLDRFGDNGMISVVVAQKQDTTWDLPIWLMSCRVLKRRVEEAILADLVARARAEGANRLTARYIPSAKNGLVKDHYAKLGFHQTATDEDGTTHWQLDLAGYSAADLPIELA